MLSVSYCFDLHIYCYQAIGTGKYIPSFFINGNLQQNITPTHTRIDENSQYYNKSKAGKVFHTLNYMLHLLSSLICWMQEDVIRICYLHLLPTRTHLHTTL